LQLGKESITLPPAAFHRIADLVASIGLKQLGRSVETPSGLHRQEHR
jgi:hypothetical protein